MALMANADRVLHQFPISHYCEKTRWHLEAKGLPYQVRNLLPGAHVVVNRRLVGGASMPVLVDRGRAIGDSTAIALHLEESYPGRALLPVDAALRARVLELEAYFDEGLGPAVRRWVYGQALATRGAVPRLFFAGYGQGARLVGRLIGSVLEGEIRRMYRIDAAGIAESSAQIDAAVERLEAATGGDPGRLLVGDSLTLADITAASLFGPLVGPPGSPWELAEVSPAFAARRDAVRARPAGQWVMERYARDRAR